MKDFFKQYHAHKMLTHAGILSMSLMLALSVNMFLLNAAPGKNLKANVLEAHEASQGSDLEVILWENNFSLTNSKDLQNVVEISFSFAYDTETLRFSKASFPLWKMQHEALENTPGFTTHILRFEEAQDIPAGTEVALFHFASSTPGNIINIIQANFRDSQGDMFLLSSENIIF
jgi:hypothetical protein